MNTGSRKEEVSHGGGLCVKFAEALACAFPTRRAVFAGSKRENPLGFHRRSVVSCAAPLPRIMHETPSRDRGDGLEAVRE
jgi:hypothetical protein